MIPLASIVGLKKSQGYVVYNCIVINTCENKEYWFGNFWDRESFFTALQREWMAHRAAGLPAAVPAPGEKAPVAAGVVASETDDVVVASASISVDELNLPVEEPSNWCVHPICVSLRLF